MKVNATGSAKTVTWQQPSILGAAIALLLLLSPMAHADALFDGIALYNQKQYRPALAKFHAAVEADPTKASAFYYRALCHQALGEHGQALQMYKAICQRFPSSPEAQLSQRYINKVDPGFKGSSEGGSLTRDNNRAGTASIKPAPSDAERLAALIGAMAAQKDSQPMSEEELSKLPDQTVVPFRRKSRSNHLYVDAYVNGRAIPVVFDTGAEVCLFGRTQLVAAGVKVNTTGPIIPISGVGAAKTAQKMEAQVTIGGITRTMPILVQDDLPTDPLLGQSFFNGFRYEIDNRGGFIRFIKKTKAGQASRVFEPTDVVSVPFTNRGNNLVVTAEVNGKPCPMYFDTGASGIVFSSINAMMLGLRIPEDAQQIIAGGVGGATPGYLFKIERIKLGPIVKTNVPITVLQNGPSLPLLGQSFFGDRRFTIDNENHVIKFVH